MRKSKLFIRKFFVVIIGIVLCFTSLTACGNNPDDENPTDSLVFQEEASATIKEVDQSKYVTFYFDAENGDDANNGSVKFPKKSLKEISRVAKEETERNEKPVRILLKRGSVFNGNLNLSVFYAEEEYPLIVGAYGDEKDGYPVISGYGSETAINAAVSIKRGNIVFENIEITGKTAFQGIYVTPIVMGALKNVTIRNCYVHDINFNWEYDTKASETNPDEIDLEEVCPLYKSDGKSYGRYYYRYYGGIIFENNSKDYATWFEDIYIINNRVENVARTGIYVMNRWANRPGVGYGNNKYVSDSREFNNPLTKVGYYPHLNIVCNGNYVECAGGDAIVLSGIEDSFLDGNTSYHANFLGRVGFWNAGIWVFSARNTYMQYNEAAYTYKRNGAKDAQGFDIDNACSNVYVRYNYSHHNEGGGILVCNNKTNLVYYNADGTFRNGGKTELAMGKWENNYITNNVFAYNGTKADSKSSALITTARAVKDLYIDNNIIILDPEIEKQSVVHTESDPEQVAENFNFANNIFYCKNPTSALFTASQLVSYKFFNNVFYNFSEEVKNYVGNENIFDFDPQIDDNGNVKGYDNVAAYRPKNKDAFSKGKPYIYALRKDIAGEKVQTFGYVGAFSK